MTKNVLVIGGGIVGLAVAREIAQLPKYEVFLYEKEIRLGEHASSRHNGVNHSGIYYPPRSLKAQLCVLSNWLNWQYFPAWNISCVATGKHIVARDEKENSQLEQLAKNGISNGVPCIQHLFGEEVTRNNHNRKREPNVHCYSALYIPTAGIFDGAAYVRRLESLAVESGVHIAKRTEIIRIKSSAQGFKVLTRETLTTRQREIGTIPREEETLIDIIINAAGTGSGKITQMVNPDNTYKIVPVRGEGVCFYQTRANLRVYSPIYLLPEESPLIGGGSTFTTGVHLTPTLNGMSLGNMVVVSPLLEDPDHAVDYTMKNPPEKFHEPISTIFPSLEIKDIQPYQSGISAKLRGTKDFVIERDSVFPNCIHLLGIDSPGATSALGIGIAVKEMLKHDYQNAQEYFKRP